MLSRTSIVAPVIALALAACGNKPAKTGTTSTPTKPAAAPTLGDLRKVGGVRLEVSCKADVKPQFARGLALLHSFFYEEARRIFKEVADQDPTCAMAQWGIAMTWWHPIWTPPTPEEMDAGTVAAKRAKELGGKTDLERGHIAAISAFYGASSTAGGPTGQSCHGPIAGDHRSRVVAFEKEMETLHAAHPQDVEVAAFYSLALLGAALPTDKTLKNQLKATEILEKFWASHRDHPGLVHYLIHGYDYPSIAQKGLPAARAYADMAPWVPHVLHMPSHIFVRLGMWPEVITSNLDSADAARQYAALRHPDAMGFEELHAIDYLLYGYLQVGDDAKAAAVTQKVDTVQKTAPVIDFVVAFSMGAIPARYSLERKQWAEAAALPVKDAPYWEKFPFARANLEYAKALGLARLGKAAEAKEGHARVLALATATTNPGHAYFAKQTRMQADALAAFITAAEGNKDAAVKALRAAADADDAIGKHPVSPGSLLPVREMLADYLLELGKPAEALVEYENCLKLNPGRYNSLFGAGRSAELSGKPDVARRHYQELVNFVVPEANRPELAQVRAYLTKNP